MLDIIHRSFLRRVDDGLLIEVLFVSSSEIIRKGLSLRQVVVRFEISVFRWRRVVLRVIVVLVNAGDVFGERLALNSLTSVGVDSFIVSLLGCIVILLIGTFRVDVFGLDNRLPLLTMSLSDVLQLPVLVDRLSDVLVRVLGVVWSLKRTS